MPKNVSQSKDAKKWPKDANFQTPASTGRKVEMVALTLAEPGIEPATSCSQIHNSTDLAMGLRDNKLKVAQMTELAFDQVEIIIENGKRKKM